MTIEQITLLSKEEYKEHKNIIPTLAKLRWWLRTPGDFSNYACYVNYDGDVYNCYYVSYTSIGVRPALLLNLEPTEPEFWCKPEKLVGSRVTYGTFTWTVLEAFNSQVYVLCDEIIAEHRFDEISNEWETSELKEWLETEGLDIIEGRTIK